MVVVYYALTHTMDSALEIIRSIKNFVTLHVFIEVTPHSKKSTVIDVESLDGLNSIESSEKVLGAEKWNYLKQYFDGVASVNFVVHKHKKSFSFSSIKVARAFGKHLKGLNADIVHFDTASVRAIGLLPFLKSKKLFITIHDPKPHSGEYSWKKNMAQHIFFRCAKGYFFYSHFACKQFKSYYKSIVAPTCVLRFQPVTYVSQFGCSDKANANTILYFGRLSQYKGIDILLKAIPKVLKKYPHEKFVIAGSPEDNFKIEREVIGQYKDNLQLVEKYLSIEELMNFIHRAKFVVCPYRDATQSGVVMTAFAAKKAVIGTNVGAFPEYIIDNKNGLLSDLDPDTLASKIMEALEKDKYKEMEKNVLSSYSEQIGIENKMLILNAYSS